MKKAVCFFLLLMISVFFLYDGLGCRYTIREIGFSDVYSKNYRLLIFTNSITAAENVPSILKLSNMLLKDSNVQLEIINIDEQKSSPALKFLDLNNPPDLPAAVFVSPGGRSMLCSFSTDKKSSEASLIESLVSSAYRNEIIKELIRSYGVVLIVEGTNDALNKQVKAAAREAVKAMKGSLDQMPKIVNEPPEIIIIPHSRINEENILLFGLGITGKNKNDTHVAIMYGRGKIAGPVLMNEQINTKRIYNLLTLVGEDCECGIDNSWMFGDVIPLRWGPEEQADLTRILGFDVENPFVKTEMSQIISLRPDSKKMIDPVEENLMGFVEERFQIGNKADAIPRISAADIRDSFLPGEQPQTGKVSGIILIVFTTILLITFATLFIYFKKKSNKL